MRSDSFGKRLRDLRGDADLTQLELSDRLEKEGGVTVGQNYVSQMENGRSLPSMPVAVALARVLGTTIDYLMMLTDDPEPPHAQPERYITPEADEVARLVDTMDAATRLQIAALVVRLAEPATGDTARERDRAFLLKLAEMNLGVEARRTLERALLRGENLFSTGD